MSEAILSRILQNPNPQALAPEKETRKPAHSLTGTANEHHANGNRKNVIIIDCVLW